MNKKKIVYIISALLVVVLVVVLLCVKPSAKDSIVLSDNNGESDLIENSDINVSTVNKDKAKESPNVSPTPSANSSTSTNVKDKNPVSTEITVSYVDESGTQLRDDSAPSVVIPTTNPAAPSSGNSGAEISVSNPNEMTWEAFCILTPEQKDEFMNSFDSIEDFIAWMNHAQEVYYKDHPAIELGEDGVIDLGQLN